MTIPAAILDAFAGLMLLVAVVSATRLAVARPWPRADTDAGIGLSHLLMGVAMAGTLTSTLRTLPDTAWEVIFGAATVWFAGRVIREVRRHGTRLLADGHHVPHLVHSAAMLYMFLALTGPRAGAAGMSGMTAPAGSTMPVLRLPTLALVFAFVLIGFVVSDLDRLSGSAALHRRPGVQYSAGVALAGAAAPSGHLSPAGPALTVSAPPAGVPAAEPETPAAGPGPKSVPFGYVPSGSGYGMVRSVFTPAVARGCRIAMGVTMAFMLIIMI